MLTLMQMAVSEQLRVWLWWDPHTDRQTFPI